MSAPRGHARLDVSDRVRIRVGRLMAVYTGVAAAVGIVLYLHLDLSERLFTDWVVQIGATGLIVAPLVWLVVSRQPRNAAVWALIWMGVLVGSQAVVFGLLQRDLAILGISSNLELIVPAELPLSTALLNQAGGWVWIGANYAFLLGLLVFPDGRLPSPRWRRAAYAIGVAGALSISVMVWLGRPTSTVSVVSEAAVAQLSAPLQAMWTAAMALMLIAGFVAFAGLVVRYRSSAGATRQQLRWIAWAGSLIVVEFLVLFPLQYSSLGVDLYRYTSLVTFSIFIAAFVVAIARYRLYEIDRIVSRTVSYALVTALLAGVYIGAVLMAQAVFGTSGDERPPTIVAGSTLLVAALFQPVRRRVQHAVDRRFNRRVGDASRIVSAFGERLRDDVSLDSLVDDLVTTAATVAQPTTVGIWMPRQMEQR